MNGLEFAKCTTAGGFSRVLIHAAPAQMSVEVVADDGQVLAASDLDREGVRAPMSLLELKDGTVVRSEIWPTDEFYGLPVLLAGGETGILKSWYNASDQTWWRWRVEFSNHVGRPADWAPPP